MIKIENTDIYGFKAAIRGMRSPMNSWGKSDTEFEYAYGAMHSFKIGENDLKLMKNLSKAGTDHSKFLRMINVTVDITAPLYWWKEADTYKVGTVANSCSTMHKIHAKEFELSDFSWEHLSEEALAYLEDTICMLNRARDRFITTKDKQHWWDMIQLLPSSYNQRRTVQLNYQVLKNMYFARKAHKLDCWVHFCEWIETLPYAKELICND